jgi:hypothetical protein
MAGRQRLAIRIVLPLVALAALLLVYSCLDEEMSAQSVPAKSPTVAAKDVRVKSLPKQGKLRRPEPPDYAVFGMIYFNTKEKREYIYDGAQWVPHDRTVENYYRNLASVQPMLAQSQVVPSDTTPVPDGTGAHGKTAYVTGGNPTKHGKYDCRVCHLVGGVLMFDPNGPAVDPAGPLPTFNATDKTCSNVACHGVPSGTFSYYFPGNEMDEEGYPIPELKTVTVYGSAGRTTPSWYATGSLACAACHDNPPRNGTDGANTWHSGFHANNQNVGPIQPNACELCHNRFTAPTTFSPIAQSTGTGQATAGTAILIPALHGNGVYNVAAQFRSQCFGCH